MGTTMYQVESMLDHAICAKPQCAWTHEYTLVQFFVRGSNYESRAWSVHHDRLLHFNNSVLKRNTECFGPRAVHARSSCCLTGHP